MATNQLSKARVKTGALYIGLTTSAGGPSVVSPTAVKGFRSIGAAINPGSISAQTVYTADVTITGSRVGDLILLIPPANLLAGLTFNAYVSASNTVTIRVSNATASPIVESSKTWNFVWIDLT